MVGSRMGRGGNIVRTSGRAFFRIIVCNNKRFYKKKKLRNKIMKILKTEEPEYYKTKFSNDALTMRKVCRTVDTVLSLVLYQLY